MRIDRATGLCAVLLWACSRSPATASTTTTAATLADAAPGDGCPLGVEGARIGVANAADGADLTIVAPADRVAELRRRARDAAQLYGAGAHKGLGRNGTHVGAHRHGLRLTELPPVEVRVDDIDDGARMHLHARIPSQVGELRARIGQRVDAVRTGPCD